MSRNRFLEPMVVGIAIAACICQPGLGQPPNVDWSKVFHCSGERVFAPYTEIVSENVNHQSSKTSFLYMRCWRSGAYGLLEFSRERFGNTPSVRTSRVICNKDYAAMVAPQENGWKLDSHNLDASAGWFYETRNQLSTDQSVFKTCFASWIKEANLESSATVQSSGEEFRQFIFVRNTRTSDETVPVKIQFDLDGKKDLLHAYTADFVFADGKAINKAEFEWDLDSVPPRIAKSSLSWFNDGDLVSKTVQSYSYPKNQGFDKSQCKLEYYGLSGPQAAPSVPVSRYLLYAGIVLSLAGLAYHLAVNRKGHSGISTQ
jgi:hypothetical protein